MNVLMVAEQLRRRVPGGIGTYIRGLSQGLGEADVDVDLRLWASRAGDHHAVEDLGRQVVSVPIPGPLLTRAWDRGLIRPPMGFEVVHATSLAVPPKALAPMTVMVHDLAWRSFPDAFPPRGRRWHDAALGRAVRRAAKLITPSRKTANDLIAGGVAPGRVVVIDEGSDHLPPPDHDSAAKRLSDLGVAGEFLLAVGTLEPRKNLARLARAYEAARPKLPEPWPLLVVGPAGWGEAFTPPEGVIAVGEADLAMIAALYERCRLLVSVPLLEGFGLPVLEAMSMGAPVVASPMPSNGDAAFEVDPTNEASIAAGLLRVATNESLRDDLIGRGRERAAKLTWKSCAEAHVRVWESL